MTTQLSAYDAIKTCMATWTKHADLYVGKQDPVWIDIFTNEHFITAQTDPQVALGAYNKFIRPHYLKHIADPQKYSLRAAVLAAIEDRAKGTSQRYIGFITKMEDITLKMLDIFEDVLTICNA